MSGGELAGWLAPFATTFAAIMTAANLGARITGLGFGVFLLGSVCWLIVGVNTGQANLVWTNGFLTFVNLIGVWRWLGRQAKYDEGGAGAARRSAVARVPTLFSLSSATGANVTGPDGDTVAQVVDLMASCEDGGIAYVVLSQGGMGGLGERLHAIDPSQLEFGLDGISTRLDAAQLADLPILNPECWPAALSETPHD